MPRDGMAMAGGGRRALSPAGCSSDRCKVDPKTSHDPEVG